MLTHATGSLKETGFSALVAKGRSCAGEHACPCCGACLGLNWGDSANGSPHSRYAELGLCPVCHTFQRHRWVCFNLGTAPPRALVQSSPLDGNPPFVAYFGPHKEHTKALETQVPNMELLKFDYFALGYFTRGMLWESTSNYGRDTVRADVQDIPLQSNVLDGVIILHVLEHVHSLPRAAGELRRVLRTGGFVEHATPCFTTTEPEFVGVKEFRQCNETSRTDRICKQVCVAVLVQCVCVQ
jgi:SAM-dependent methyltransferase